MIPQQISLPLGGAVPNNPLPARLYRSAFEALTPAQIETRLAEHGWTNAWRNGIYPYHHYHSTAHEVLAIARGQVSVTLGGEGGVQVQVGAGDVLVLPAGTGHRSGGGSPDLLVIGAYADGCPWDTCRPEQTDADAARQRIWQVPGPELDPVTGQRWEDSRKAVSPAQD